MVNDQMTKALLAVVLGLGLAVVLFLPFTILNYRRRGRLTLGRTLVWVASLIYAMALWIFTLVPFPNPDELHCAGRNTQPLAIVGDILDRPHDSWRALLHNVAFLEFGYNIILFVPLGFVVRLLWGRGWVFATSLGLVLSVFIEATQLTGVWGLYDCAYRVADVDDLIANTAGALLGSWLSWPAARLFKLDQPPDLATVAGPPTRGRRLTGMVCDVAFGWLLGFGLVVAIQLTHQFLLGYDDSPSPPWLEAAGWLAPAVLLLLVVVATGRTPGDWAVQLRWRRPARPEARADRLATRLSRRLLRGLGGIVGYLLISPLGDVWPAVFALVSLVAAFVTRDRRGLPGLVSGLRPEVCPPTGATSVSRPSQATSQAAAS